MEDGTDSGAWLLYSDWLETPPNASPDEVHYRYTNMSPSADEDPVEYWKKRALRAEEDVVSMVMYTRQLEADTHPILFDRERARKRHQKKKDAIKKAIQGARTRKCNERSLY